MSDEATRAQAAAGGPAAGEGAANQVNAGAWPPGAPGQADGVAVAGQRPELAVAAAFGGGLLAALLLRRLASGH